MGSAASARGEARPRVEDTGMEQGTCSPALGQTCRLQFLSAVATVVDRLRYGRLTWLGKTIERVLGNVQEDVVFTPAG